MAQVIEMLPHGRQGPTYLPLSDYIRIVSDYDYENILRYNVPTSFHTRLQSAQMLTDS